MDLRRHAELVYRFLGVGSVPNDTLAWIEKNNAAEAKAKETGVIVRNKGIPFRTNTSRSRYVTPYRSRERSGKRVVDDKDEEYTFEYELLPEKRRVKRQAATNSSVLGSRYLSPSENVRIRRMPPAEDSASRSRYLSHSQRRGSRRRIAPVAVDAYRSGYALRSQKRGLERPAPGNSSAFGSRYLSPSENVRIRRVPAAEDDASRSRYLPPYHRWERPRRRRIRPVHDDDYDADDDVFADDDDDAYVFGFASRSEERRIERPAPTEGSVFGSRYLSPSENVRLRQLTPAEDGASRSRYVKYVSPLEKWKKRLTPADSAAIVNDEICREYFRLARTNPN